MGVAEEARRADAAALFDAHYGRLAGWAAGALGSQAAGQDVAAEAFTRLFARLRTVREPRAFLYAVAANLIRDQYRRDRRAGAAAHDLLRRTSAVVDGPDLALRDLVGRLPDRLRMPLLLHYYADLPVDDVARILHRPAGTVKRWLAEARAALATQWEEAPDA